MRKEALTTEDEKKLKRAKIIIHELKKLYPKPKIALNYSNVFELLVAVILSAQCTDKKVNEVTEKLFKKYNSIDKYVNASSEEFQEDIRSTGFYRNKAKNIQQTAKLVKRDFKGKVPMTMEELIKLPGVARKTANIVLSVGYGIVEGIAVDTHVKRLSSVHGLSNQNDPDKIEQDLMKIIPRQQWSGLNLRLVEYGRDYCPAKKHDHQNCPLVKVLDKYK